MNQLSRVKFNTLPARWEHTEHEGIVTDKIGRGDISSWSRATTKARRPEVALKRDQFKPIRSLNACSNLALAKRANEIADAAKPKQEIVAPLADDFSETAFWTKQLVRKLAIVKQIDAHYKKCRKRLKKQPKHVPEPAKPGLLDDCPPSDLSTIEHKDVERENVVRDKQDHHSIHEHHQVVRATSMAVDWRDKDSVIRYAKRIATSDTPMVVHKEAHRPNFNICHKSRTDLYSAETLVFATH
jgi:hypothetical protein